ncbi:MAG: hypothetical protein IPI95_09265 [Flavobacteriales bacterium]|nr:hypothetical protein [Flavobacteriales bacterium]
MVQVEEDQVHACGPADGKRLIGAWCGHLNVVGSRAQKKVGAHIADAEQGAFGAFHFGVQGHIPLRIGPAMGDGFFPKGDRIHVAVQHHLLVGIGGRVYLNAHRRGAQGEAERKKDA